MLNKYIQTALSYRQDLVLVGGGHAHIQVLRMMAMNPCQGVRVTLISDRTFAPYSGMLPGVLAGWYSYDDAHFDLANLCARAGVRFVSATAAGIDVQRKAVLFEDRPALRYDVASVNVGIRPASLGGADERFLMVKPITRFLEQWEDFKSRVAQCAVSKVRCDVAVIGGGASGVEIAFLAAKVLGDAGADGKVTLLHSGDRILDGHHQRVTRIVQSELAQAGVEVKNEVRVLAHAGEGILNCAGNVSHGPFALVIGATHAQPPLWFAQSQLPTDERGFLKVDRHLRVFGQDDLFAAGDSIQFNGENLPKSGVFAVRQGPVLYRNLRRALQQYPLLEEYRPQGRVLALMTLGRQEVVASFGVLGLKGRWLWRVKDYIDRTFMDKWRQIPLMNDAVGMRHMHASMDPAEWAGQLNTCGGCGAKAAPRVLQQALVDHGQLLTSGPEAAGIQWDDSAVIPAPAGKVLVTSTDAFRAFSDDPFLMGRVAAMHAMSDVYSMGAAASSSLCQVTLRDGPESGQASDLRQAVAGMRMALSAHGASLVGGHTTVGLDFSIGLTVQGWADPQRIWRKQGARVGDALILTKPLGTGAVLAGLGEESFSGHWWDELMEHLLQPHYPLLSAMTDIPVHAATDVTGFGLMGHLLEMFADSSLAVKLSIQAIPYLDGFRDAVEAGVTASLTERNSDYAAPYLSEPGVELLRANPLAAQGLFDPQTCGGMLLAVPNASAGQVIASLQNAGYVRAAVIGEVCARRTAEFRLQIID